MRSPALCIYKSYNYPFSLFICVFIAFDILTIYSYFSFNFEHNLVSLLTLRCNGITGISANIHCSLVTQPPIGPMGPETS